jgi:competence protein ComEC
MNRTRISPWLSSFILLFTLVGCSQDSSSAIPTIAQTGKGLHVFFLDVGQGDSILIQTPKGENILIDGGNNSYGYTILHALKQLNVVQLDVVIGTHPDADHIGGLDTVIDQIPVKAIYSPKVAHNTITYEDFLVASKNKGIKLKDVRSGMKLPFSDVDATFVGPVKAYGSDTNDWSAVLRVSYGENAFLFTGDAPIRAEKDMIESGEELQADVLKVGHHGSKTATSQEFLDKVNPKYAVISVGKDNRYGLPNDEVLNRLTHNHIQMIRTDQKGTIEAISDGTNITFKTISTPFIPNTTAFKAIKIYSLGDRSYESHY